MTHEGTKRGLPSDIRGAPISLFDVAESKRIAERVIAKETWLSPDAVRLARAVLYLLEATDDAVAFLNEGDTMGAQLVLGWQR